MKSASVAMTMEPGAMPEAGRIQEIPIIVNGRERPGRMPRLAAMIEALFVRHRDRLVGVHALHQPTVGRPDFRLTGTGRKAKDLIGLLICHGARIRRAARPRCRIALDVVTPSGHSAVEISFE